MHRKSALPTAEGSVLPIRAIDVEHGEERQPVPPIEPQLSPQAQGAEGVETYQADRALHAMLARLSGGISPAALLLAYTDWLSHLAASPQRQIEIAQEALVDAKRFLEAAQRFFSPGQGPWSLIQPQPQDKRFGRPEWEYPPFNLMAQAFLLGQRPLTARREMRVGAWALPPIIFPGSPERWWGDEALQAEAQAPQAPREQ